MRMITFKIEKFYLILIYVYKIWTIYQLGSSTPFFNFLILIYESHKVSILEHINSLWLMHKHLNIIYIRGVFNKILKNFIFIYIYIYILKRTIYYIDYKWIKKMIRSHDNTKK